MAAAAVKFEVFVNDTDRNTQPYLDFRTALAQLVTIDFYQVYSIDSAGNNVGGLIIHGIITPAQASSALALLVTLNTALGKTLQAVSYPCTTQP